MLNIFGVLWVISEFSSPEFRDFTNSNTLLTDIHKYNHQNQRHRPDHQRKRK